MSLQKVVVPAIIAKDQQELDMRLKKVLSFSSMVQLDVMDHRFVPNSSLFFNFHLPKTSTIFEAHLMVADPLSWINQHGDQVDLILAHYESVRDQVDVVIDKVKALKKQVGLVLNPETSVEVLTPFLDQIDQVLVMTVNPGFYGSPFLPDVLSKIRYIRKQMPDLNIEVDGGITDKTITSAYKAGANLFVTGSFIVKSAHPQKAMATLQKLVGIL